MEPENNYTDVVETLWSMFGDVASREVIVAVVEHCNGDLQLAAEAVITIACDKDCEMVIAEAPVTNEEVIMTNNSAGLNDTNTTNATTSKMDTTPKNYAPDIENIPLPQAPYVSETTSPNNIQKTNSTSFSLRPMSYVFTNSARNTGAIPKQARPLPITYNPKSFVWTDQIRNIVNNHNQGYRILIFMRGAPGSGKTYLAKKIIDMCVGSTDYLHRVHIFSTDDFFIVRGDYIYDKSQLSQAHEWNQRRVDVAIRQGLSPVIVDNTNIEPWEMEPYLRVGVRYGFIIEVVEPNTPWAKQAYQLQKKNIHNVPIHTIARHLENFKSYTGSNLIERFELSYPANMVPPVKRNLPKVKQTNQSSSGTENKPVVLSIEPPTKTENESETIPTNDLATIETSSFNIFKENKENKPQPIDSLSLNFTENVAAEVNTLQVFNENKNLIKPQTVQPSSAEKEQKEVQTQSQYLEIDKQLEDKEQKLTQPNESLSSVSKKKIVAEATRLDDFNENKDQYHPQTVECSIKKENDDQQKGYTKESQYSEIEQKEVQTQSRYLEIEKQLEDKEQKLTQPNDSLSSDSQKNVAEATTSDDFNESKDQYHPQNVGCSMKKENDDQQKGYTKESQYSEIEQKEVQTQSRYLEIEKQLEDKEQKLTQPNESLSSDSQKNVAEATTSDDFDESKDQYHPQTVGCSMKKENDDQQKGYTKESQYSEMEKLLEDFSRVEKEWDNGERWDDTSRATVKDTDTKILAAPKPARSESQMTTSRRTLMNAVKECGDWSKISIFMPQWTDNQPKNENKVEIPIVSMKHASTSVDSGDADLQNPSKIYKVLCASSRNINLFNIPRDNERISHKSMLDASTTTNDFVITGAFRCRNEEQHFLSLRKMFRNVREEDLRYIFDQCRGDVNWAVEIIVDGVTSQQLATVEDLPELDTEEDITELCNCLAAYGIVPGSAPVVTSSVTNEKNIPDSSRPHSSAITTQKKSKVAPSETSIELKRQIEKNFVIPDDHYSAHCLKIRKFRRGEYDVDTFCDNGVENIPEPMFDVAQALPVDATNLVTAGPAFGPALDDKEPDSAQKYYKRSPSTDRVKASSPDSDDESSYASSFDGNESTVSITLGWDMIKKLDGMFGRDGMTYPDNVQPNINIPVTLLNEINAFWIESLMNQMDEQDKLNAKLLKEDEEFARQIQMQEAELARQGKEPEVPDFKEIMDMDLALSLYLKEVAEWRNSEPNDLAARMTREKLYNLFPELSKDTLAELLMAHDNNFKVTVETLLVSTGKENVVNSKDGLNKFVMERELARQQKLLEEEKLALTEVEWPLLPHGQKLDMSAVNSYRKQADQHLQKRQQNHEKAVEYVRRGMTGVALHYSQLAHFHTRQYEQSSSLAASCLMQIHASNCPNTATVDLHFLRVAEAKETLDLFIDTHICKLQESLAKGPGHGPRSHKLFFITGRGAHSHGGRAKVKPAVRKRLRERGLCVSESNPGLLSTTVTADDKLSYQIA